MKKMMTAVALLGLSLPVMAQALEFQTPGALGMGRAGVARTTDAYATFINPAGLAFYDKPFSMRLGAGAGVAISSSLAENLDKVGKLDLSNSNMNYTTATDATNATTKAVQFAGIVDDLAQRKGDLAVNVDLALAFQYRNYGLGIFGMTELGAGIGHVDKDNLRMGNATSGVTAADNVNTLAINMFGYTNVSQITLGNTARPTTTIFSAEQYQSIWKAFQNAGGGVANVTDTTAQALASKLEAQLASTGANGNTTNLTPDQLVSAIKLTADLISPTKGSIDSNTTTVKLMGLALVEVPIGYGHKFDLGRFGKLGIGGAAKVMQGSVYYQEQEINKLKDSKDATTKAKDQHAESTQFGIDLGALWRYEDFKAIGPINVGLALKNLNSPKFDGPRDPKTQAQADKVTIEPQGRLGLALEPFSWLSLAADFDVTKNKTVIEGRDSQNIGGGLEAHVSWAALRLGAFKNMAETDGKPVLTGGLSLGPQWLRLDIDAAVATATGTYDNKSYPREAKVEFGLSTMF